MTSWLASGKEENGEEEEVNGRYCEAKLKDINVGVSCLPGQITLYKLASGGVVKGKQRRPAVI